MKNDVKPEQIDFNEILEILLKVIDRLPDPPREKVKKELNIIKELLMDNRAPRILILGRRGAGKSSLINAIFNEPVAKIGSVLSETGKAEWHAFENDKGAIDILDTRGIGDRSRPESANFTNAIEDIKAEIKVNCPDAVLFLCKAKEVDAHITKDIENVIEIRKFISSNYDYDPPVVALLTQVDELDPKRIEPPYEDKLKQENIKKAVRALNDSFSASNIGLLKVMPVSAYAEYENDIKSYDNYWNIDILIEYLMEILPNSAQLQLARLSSLKKAQVKVARVLTRSTATICAAIAATPIPVADVIPITTAQLGMIMGIAFISGRELSKKSAMEFLAALGINVGAGFVLREGARALIKFVFPGGGNMISAGVAAAGSWGIGEAAISYFIDGKDIDEAKQRFKAVKKEHEKEGNG